METYYIGIDDTDNLDSRGTGRLARDIAERLSEHCTLMGVTRHQLLLDPGVAYTKKNSSAAILLRTGALSRDDLFDIVRDHMMADMQIGSDPGLCVANQVPIDVTAFGLRVKHSIVTQDDARLLAEAHNLYLQGLGGDEGGVIGALAAVGLVSGGQDGRYVQVGRVRDLQGLQPVSAVLEAGIASVETLEGVQIEEGLVRADKLRPARRYGMPVLFIARNGEVWDPIKVD
jgi:hypothetical protein